MGWKHWYESKKILEEKGRQIYVYDVKDNEDENGMCIGLFPETKESGEWLSCFPEEWKNGQVAVKQWQELKRGDVGGLGICNCGKHIAIWSAGRGLIDILERTLIVYEVDKQIADKIMAKSGFWNSYDPELRETIRMVG
jgi:hypothetical protein